MDKIKKLFSKTLSLAESDKGNLITYVKLKNKTLKLGQEITIDQGYNLVSVYYNRFCDIVGEGKQTLDETTLPKMYRLFYNATKKEEEKISNEIADADLYFLNLNQLKIFVRTGKMRFVSNGEKVKARLQCEIEYKICDIKKFMEYFANEFAILKNGKVVGEINYFLREKIEKCLAKSEFEDLFSKKEEVEKIMLERTQELREELGLEVVTVVLNEVEVPKKYLGKKIIAKNKVETSEEVLKMAENSINGVKEEQHVYVGVNKDLGNQREQEEIKQSASKENFNQQNNEDLRKGNEFLKQEQVSVKQYVSCDDIIADVNKSQVALQGNKNWEDSYSVASEPYIISDAPQGAPNLFEEPKQEPIKEVEQAPKVVTKYKVVIKCPCCGAKNEETAEYCMVCKSKL